MTRIARSFAAFAPTRTRTKDERTPILAARRRLAGYALVAVGAMACIGHADDKNPTGKGRAEALAMSRFELMRKRVASAKVESGEQVFPRAFSPEPIFKYNDPTRGFVAGAVWKLGDEGRPKALLATELRRSSRALQGRPSISYEFTSLTATPFSLRSDDMGWSPAGTRFEFKPIPKAQAPEATPQRRLRQLREIARRFASNEEYNREKHELRLLSTPVDRYTPSGGDQADGAIFFFTLGTNPEVVLLIETDGKGWSYAAGKMTGAQVVALTLDGAVAWEGAPPGKNRDSSSTGSIFPIDIPGIGADGSEIPE
jgi:hypothetical protein